MTSKYAQMFNNYEQNLENRSFVRDKAENFIYCSKKEPSIMFMPLGDKFYPLPMHTAFPIKDGGHRSFVCRRFINQPCYICDNLKNPYHADKKALPSTDYTCLGIQMENSTTPMLVDVKVSKKTGDAVLAKHPEIRGKVDIVEDDEGTTFIQIPKVGILTMKKSVDQSIAMSLMGTNYSFNDVWRVMRSGEGLKTVYNTTRMGDPINTKNLKVRLAILLHETLDDYIDSRISLKYYESAFGVDLGSSDEEDSGEQEMDDEEPPQQTTRKTGVRNTRKSAPAPEQDSAPAATKQSRKEATKSEAPAADPWAADTSGTDDEWASDDDDSTNDGAKDDADYDDFVKSHYMNGKNDA